MNTSKEAEGDIQKMERLKVSAAIGEGFDSPIDSVELLERIAAALVEHYEIEGCQLRLLSRDQRILEHQM